MDIYEKIVPDASESHYVYVGRIATVVITLLGILWIPIIRGMPKELYHYLQSVQAYIGPPIAAIFLLGVFFHRINAPAAVSTLIGGFAVGMLRLVAELFKSDLTGVAHWFADMNFLYFAILLFVLSVVNLIVVSALTRAPSREKLDGLTYATTAAEDAEASRRTWGTWDVVHSVIICLAIVAIFAYFTG